MRKQIHDFIFLGGSTRIEKRSRKPTEDFSACAQELVGYYPAIFPEGCDPLEGSTSAVVDVPINREDMRCFCVYFCTSTGRAFWNVLCFSYSVKDWSRNDLQCVLALSEREWYDAALTLEEDSTALTLPDHPAGENPCAENWLPHGVFVRDFPVSDTQGLTASAPGETDWRSLLHLPRKKVHPIQEPTGQKSTGQKPLNTEFTGPSSGSSVDPPDGQEKQRLSPGFFLGFFLGIIIGGLMGWGLTREFPKASPERNTSQDTPQDTPQLPAPQSETGRWIISPAPAPDGMRHYPVIPPFRNK